MVTTLHIYATKSYRLAAVYMSQVKELASALKVAPTSLVLQSRTLPIPTLFSISKIHNTVIPHNVADFVQTYACTISLETGT